MTHRRRPRAGGAAGLPGPPRPLDGVDLRLPRHRHRRARTSPGCSPPAPCAGMQGLDLSRLRIALERRRAGRPRRRRGLRRRGRAASASARARCSRAFGMAEVAIGGTFPPPMRGMVCDTVDRVVLERDARRQAGRDRDPTTSARAPAAAARPARARPRDPHRRPRHRRGAARAPRRRAADPRHVGDARLLQAPRRHRRAVPRRLAAHRRPRLPARRRAGAVRAHQGRDHRRRPQRVPGGHRARRAAASTACAPAT